MTHQIEHSPGVLSPSLRAKLHAFTDLLTPEEQAQLRSLQPDEATAMLSPSLDEKARQTAESLTPEERAQLRLMLERATVGAEPSSDADATGHMMKQVEGRERGRTLPGELPPGSSGPGGAIIDEIWNRTGIPQAWWALKVFL